MRVAALYDVHGNLPALEAVLADVRAAGADHVVVGGDVVPGPMPRESLEALRELGVPTSVLLGNGEREVLEGLGGRFSEVVPEAFHEVLRWNGAQLTEPLIAWLARWPAGVELDVDGLGRVHFCHGTPRSDAEIFTEVTPADALLPVLREAGAPTVVCGHTHMQFDRRVGDVRVVNAGSVGMPFGEPGAYWALLGPTVELRRTAYDLEEAAARIRATEYPMARGFADEYVRAPPNRAAMVEAMERGALRGSST